MRAPLLLLLAGLAASAGCLRSFEPPHEIAIDRLDLKPDRVMSQEVLLNLTTVLTGRGSGAASNVSLQAKAYSEDTGFLLAESETPVGDLAGETTHAVSQLLSVPRSGGVRLDVRLFEGDAARGGASISARNLQSLEPNVLDTGLRIGDVDFLVRNATNDTKPRIETDLYVTNEGSQPSEDLRVQVKAREVTTRLVADTQWVETGAIAPGATVIRAVNLTVPDHYNYVFEIVTWRGESIVARTEGNVQLAPTFEKPKDQELVVTQPNLNDFVTATPTTIAYDASKPGGYASGPAIATPSAKVPGLGLAAGLAAAGAAALALRRWRQ